MTSGQDRALLVSDRTRVVHLELTSRCNLCCVYCAVSQPDYGGVDFDLTRFDDLLESLVESRVEFVYVNGHGESTMIDGWEGLCDRLLARGFKLGIVTNLARRLEPTEVATLARFTEVCVSCDTVEPELFTRLRRKASLALFWDNLERSRVEGIQRDGRGPRLSISCVVSDQVVMGLPELVRRGIEAGVAHFEFCNLTKYPDLPGAIAVAHISSMSLDRMIQARQAIEDANRLAEQHGRSWSIQAGLLDLLEQRIGELSAGSKNSPTVSPTAARSMIDGQTRLCLDPWSMLYVQASGVVRSCCWNPEPMGDLSQGDSLRDIPYGNRFRELRRQLLTGELPSACTHCPARPWVPIDKQRETVRIWQAGGPRRWGWLRRGAIVMVRGKARSMANSVRQRLRAG
jgi:MoaA/NifB/PqqE/SkfB family radical SAM enzyme